MFLNKNKKEFHKKIIATAILFLFVFSLITSAFLIPQPAQAVLPVTDWPKFIWDKITYVYEKARKEIAAKTYKVALSGYLNKLAEEMGTYYATGGKGAKPLFVTDRKKWLKEVKDGVAGDLINNIAKGILGGTCASNPKQTCKTDTECMAGVNTIDLGEITHYFDPNPAIPQAEIDALFKKGKDMGIKETEMKVDTTNYKPPHVVGQTNTKGKCIIKGFDLCEVDLQLRASLIAGVKVEFEEYESKCPLSKMKEHYKELKNRNKIEDWVDFQKYFNPEANEIGAHLVMVTQIIDQQDNKEKIEKELIPEGIFPVKEKISGDVKTPSPQVKAAVDSTIDKSSKVEETPTGNMWADAFGIFAKSFAKKWLKLLFEKGFSGPPPPDNNNNSAVTSWANIQAAEKIYSSIFTPKIISGGNYDILTNYLSCPDDLNFAKADQCVLNQEMGSLLQNNERLSFQDAIDKNKENNSYNWVNLPVGKDKSGAVLNQGSQNEGFSLANIKKMRLARIVPIGLEFAAKKIIDSSDIDSKSLKEIVEKFNDNTSPFYHLVDPNWILKIPQHQCQAMAFGSTLEAPGSNQRNEACVDLQSCLKNDADNNCQGAWGYCVREKNIWRFGEGDQCPERFNTCQTFQKDNATVTFLQNTLDFNGCDSANSGCLWYSKLYVKGKELCAKNLITCQKQAEDTCNTAFETCQQTESVTCDQDLIICNTEQKAPCDTNFTTCNTTNETDSFSVANRIYFNKNAQTCASQNDGCHEFIQLTDIADNLTNKEVLDKVQNDLEKDDDYSNYATVNKIYLNKNRLECSATNAGCEKYTPTNGDSWIPGIIKQENICLPECVGYKTYHQLGTNFEAPIYPSYLIPNGKQCSASDVGCDEFTNLDEVAKGGEGKEYYTYLRHCVKTNEPSCGVFYTWVGSDTQGFQLKSYNLQKDGAGPKITNVLTDLGPCESETDAINNPECKEFYDELGNVYYKIYKKTITCSDDCHPLRRTEFTDQLGCETYGGTWEINESRCIFMAIPKEGTTCSFASAGCRAYRGNYGDNIRIILQNDFENMNFEGWDNVEISSEASMLNGHSIKSSNTPITDLIQLSEGVMPNLLIQNKSYEISFWAKSGGVDKENVEVKFNDGNAPLSFGIQEIGTDWNKYTFGPLLFNRLINELEKLEILGNVYVDNIILKEITNDIYLIKNSWNIPISCDQTLIHEDLPQAMLNCEEYQDRRGAFQYLKSFSKICDEKQIGCQTLIDTQNSLSPYEQTIKEVVTPPDAVVYYVNNPLNYCPSQEKGCESFGLPDLDVNGAIKKDKYDKQIWKDVYLKNDPDKYETNVCLNSEMSCQEYKYGENNSSIAYFKDPKDKVCDYKLVSGQTEYGWYKKGTESGLPDCQDDGKILQGWVGNCSNNYSGCTEFIDPLDNQSFYYLNNDKIDRSSPNGLVSKKEGKILFNDSSKKELIYNAEETYKNSETQGKGVAPSVECNSPTCFNGDVLIDPLPAGCKANQMTKCDANSIIKVDRDRICGQWLSCASSNQVMVNNKQKNICNQIGLCSEFEENASSGCDKWVTTGEGEECLNDLECLSGKCENKICAKTAALTTDNYQTRNISWDGLDYSGYVIANQYPIFTLKQLDHQEVNKTCDKDSDCLSGKCEANKKCALSPVWGLAYGYLENHQCKNNTDCLSGICTNDKCSKENISIISKFCRAYPEATSPFPMNVVNQDGFQGANFCSSEETTDNACECSYKKAETADWNTAYFNVNTAAPSGICSEGINEKMGKRCSKDDDCCVGQNGEDINCLTDKKGQCSAIRKANTYYGWKGYCLEKDVNGNCITWFPIDNVEGEPDSFSSDFKIADMQSIDSNWKGQYCEEDDSFTQTITQYGKVYCEKEQKDAITVTIFPPAPKAGLNYKLESCAIGTYPCKIYKKVDYSCFLSQTEETTKCQQNGGECKSFVCYKRVDSSCQNAGSKRGNVSQANFGENNTCYLALSCNGSTSHHGEAWAYLQAVYKANYCKEVASIPFQNIFQGSGVKLQVYKDYKNHSTEMSGYHNYPTSSDLAYSYGEMCTPFGSANLPDGCGNGINSCQAALFYDKEINCSSDAGSRTSYNGNIDNLRKLFVKADIYSFSPPEIINCQVATKPISDCQACLNNYTLSETYEQNDACNKIEYEKCIGDLNNSIKKGYESGCYSKCTPCTPCPTCNPPTICPVCPDVNNCQECPIGFDKKLFTTASEADTAGYVYGYYDYDNDIESDCANNSEGLCVCQKNEPVEGYPTYCLENAQTITDCPSCSNGFVQQLYNYEDGKTHGFRYCKTTQNLCVCQKDTKNYYPTFCQEESKLPSDCSAPNRGFITTKTLTNSEAEQEGFDKCLEKENACICKAKEGTSGYQKTDDWDDMPYTESLPIIHEAIQPKPGEKYSDLGITGIIINNKTSGEITDQGKGYVNATVAFFAMADPNQAPIREINIDWGDDTESNVSGSFLNHVADKITETKYCADQNICIDTPFIFVKTYIKQGTFAPTVKITDNWGKTINVQSSIKLTVE